MIVWPTLLHAGSLLIRTDNSWAAFGGPLLLVFLLPPISGSTSRPELSPQCYRVASFLWWSKRRLPLLKKRGKVFPGSAPWKQNFPCACARTCAKCWSFNFFSSVKRRSPSLLRNLLSQVPLKIVLFWSVSLIVVFTPLPASKCIFNKVIEFVQRRKLHLWLTLMQTMTVCIKYEYKWKEYSPYPQLMVWIIPTDVLSLFI